MLDQSGKSKILILVLHNLSERKLTPSPRSRFTLSRADEPRLACERFISNSKSLKTRYIYSGGFIVKLHCAKNAEHFITAIYTLLFTVPWLIAAKTAKPNTFTCKLCDCTFHTDWLFTATILGNLNL